MVQIKKIIKCQKIRHLIMSLFFWLPDRLMLSIQYYLITNRWPNLNNPKRFTEKIQWYKMHYRNPEILQCVDKFLVREFVAKKMGNNNILNELYQICDTADEINFSALPDNFVIKTTDGGNGDCVMIVKDKRFLNIKDTIRQINQWRNRRYYILSREWAYIGAKKSQIVIEKYLDDDTHKGGLVDYKFFCFSGNPYVCQIISDRFADEHIDFYDMNWNRLNGLIGLNPNASNFPAALPKPLNYEKMIDIAKKLSEDFPFVRVDLYNIKGNIYFGELTFYPSSGYGFFKPDSFDFELGNIFKIKP